MFQKGFNYSQDGRGNRLVYHLQGCNMHCPWCANPEGMPPEGAWITEKGKSPRLSCREWETEQIVDEVLNCVPMFFDGGGVTFTGGEATMQYEALKEILVSLKKKGIHTAVETNGTHPGLAELFPYIDQLIMDCKHWDDHKHREYTGIPFEIVYRNLVLAAGRTEGADIRIPLIGGVNDSEEDMDRFVSLFQSLPSGRLTFEVLKYHEFGKKKWEECGRDYQMGPQAHVTREQMKCFKEKIIAAGLQYKKS